MKNLIVLILFAIAAMAGESKKGELSPEKEAFLNARYEEFKKSCAQKDARACKRVILFYQKQAKKQNEKDIREAMQILLGACKDGKFDACAAAGEMYINNKDFIAAREILSPACDSGYQDACVQYGKSLEADGAPGKDEKHAKKLYETACERGSALGCEHLGLAIGGRALEQVVDYLRKACEMDAWRCFRFGTMAMPYGAEEAIKALARSCRETDMLAGCIMLAKYHEKELREISGEAEVKRLYARLCELVPHGEHCQKAR
ncbi:tetratricopeptide repeat protein [Campylobacter rectus]|uniref:tetratricopeptide repeat protein n=1 Tax=Campylobacter rectus TaxID=203 RepID=UPI000F5D6132|nr:sel1 repeat family protein [Campylobacter rectus]RRD55376.1 sel1 repeat family protein [Campylobacter rectus]